MPSISEKARREVARRELARREACRSLESFCERTYDGYQSARHTRVMISHLEALERREIQNLILQLPPRSGKSFHASERFPAWFVGKRPRAQIIMAGNSAELAEGSSRKVRSIVEDERYPFIEVKVDEESRAAQRWQTTTGGIVIAVGVSSAVVGRGADCLIIDDPVKSRQEVESPLQRDRMWNWYTDEARTRLMPGGAQLVCTTRWSDDDLVGRILNSRDSNRWTVLSFPAIAIEDDVLGRKPGEALWPEWYPVEDLLVTKEVLGPRSWASLYQQNPIPDEGNAFRPEWFKNFYTEAPPRAITQNTFLGTVNSVKKNMVVVQAIDSAWKTGISNDFSVIATWGADQTDFYLLDLWRGRAEYPDLVKRVQEYAEKWRPAHIYVEEAASGQALVQQFRHATRLPVIGIRPIGPKEARADAVTGAFEAQKVKLPKDAPWLDDWISEHLRFPVGAHDDQVDTTSLALGQLMNRSYSLYGRRSNAQLSRDLSNWMAR